MKGTVEQVWENESRNGQTYLAVQIDGERYTVWDQEYFGQFKEGSEVEYEFRQSGDFKNITDVGTSENQPNSPTYGNSRDRQITRLSCLKSAARVLAPAQVDPEEKQDMVIGMARRFENYITEDEDLDDISPGGEPYAGNSQ